MAQQCPASAGLSLSNAEGRARCLRRSQLTYQDEFIAHSGTRHATDDCHAESATGADEI